MKVVNNERFISLRVMFFLLFLVSSLMSSFAREPVNSLFQKDSPTSMLFYYRPNDRILIKDYKTNHVRSNELWSTIHRHYKELREGRSHLQITVYVCPADLCNKSHINVGSIYGNILRSLIQQRARINCAHCTFYFDTTQVMRNRACVKYVPTPVKQHSNQNIFYTLHKSATYLSLAYTHYYKTFGKIPVLQDECGEDTVYAATGWGNRDQPRADSGPQLSRPDTLAIPMERVVHDTVVILALPVQIISLSDFRRSYMSKRLFFPRLGIKTNLLYWGGIDSEFNRNDPVPNVELELYGHSHVSLNADFSYIYKNKTNRHLTEKTWGKSGVGLEPRYWLCHRGRYSGLYVGLYGFYGQFDLKDKDVTSNARTGNVYEGGGSLGYYLPLSSRWGLEVGGRYGYQKLDGSLYEWIGTDSYRTDSYTSEKLKLTTVRFLLTYRFGTHIKKNHEH